MDPIAEDYLTPDTWYYGIGRTGPVALWTGEMFYSLNSADKQYSSIPLQYGDEGFVPYNRIDQSITPAIIEAIKNALYPFKE